MYYNESEIHNHTAHVILMMNSADKFIINNTEVIPGFFLVNIKKTEQSFNPIEFTEIVLRFNVKGCE